MAFEQTWRWFGPQDPISLEEIRQTGATGIVTALHDVPVGKIWTEEAIMERKRRIAAEGMSWSVAESLPVHDDIKRRSGNYHRFIENYRLSLRNLGRCGIDTVCYNFMPVLDWSRTDLHVEFSDGSITTKFELAAFAAFDIYLLHRPGAEQSYSGEQLRKARQLIARMHEDEKVRLLQTILLGFPGSGDAFTLEGLRAALETYEGMNETGLRENLHLFLKEVIPVAEEAGVFMALHPDDPPWPLLGLPRIVGTESDLDFVVQAANSPHNGITFCTGSLGAGAENNLVRMSQRFAERISFVHLRNVRRTGERDFLEDNHMEGDVDMYGVMTALLREQRRRTDAGQSQHRMPMRPDHGHLMAADRHRKGIYPGYSLFGRMRGLAELRGMEIAIRRACNL
jgi:mannonate dehydratase